MSASDQAETATACETCAKVFDRQDVSVSNVETKTIELDYSELRASAKSGCDWCSVQCQSAFQAYEKLATDKFGIEEMGIAIRLYLEIEQESAIGTDLGSSVTLKSGMLLYSHPQSNDILDTTNVYFMPFSEGSIGVRYHEDFPGSTSSDACESLVTSWWDQCRECHTACQTGTEPWLPTRLLDTDGPLKLVSTLDLSKYPPPPYIALSHRWGSFPGNIFKLTSFNETKLKSQVPLEELSQSFCEAIEFTQRLKVRYLWIDSLCIMQDSEDDWQAEAAMMSQVYKQSALNIAINSAKATSSGMFQVRSSDTRRCLSIHQRAITRKEGSKRFLLTLRRNLEIACSERTLHCRAWVIQERLLSPRTVHFSEQLFWECRSSQASETFPLGIPCADQQLSLKRASVAALKQEMYDLWHEMLRLYVGSGLTFPSDRFVALGAIAKDFEQRVQTKYFAGLWMAEMPQSLMWVVFPPADHVLTRQSQYRCPTWSWASLDFPKGAYYYPDRETGSDSGIRAPLVLVEDTHIASLHGNFHTKIQSAEIILRGRIKRVNLDVLRQCRYNEIDIGYYYGGCRFDLGADAANDDNIHILPVLTRQNGDDFSGGRIPFLTRSVSCLLLKGVQPIPPTFERIGVVVVSHLQCPDELKWVLEMADMDDLLNKLPDRLTLV